ncbi:hypothetical protein [Spongiactinospora sp. 9N601]|uniref:hypothetical protein n=1 Tax=Spongiactinospora sp. 9N601 TaxID=3375149 RepID=UPI00379464FA
MDLIVKALLEAMFALGIDELRRRYFWRPLRTHAPTSGPPASELHAEFEAGHGPRPSVVMVGLRRGDAWHYSIPVRYGDRLRLQLSRGVYQLCAWFFADLPESAAPTLVAIAHQEIRVLSNRPEKFVVRGHEPTHSQLAEILSVAPARGLPFLITHEQQPLESAGGVGRRAWWRSGRSMRGAPQADGRLARAVRRSQLRTSSTPFPLERRTDSDFEPELVLVCAPVCGHVDPSGNRCAEAAAGNGTRCPAHAGHDSEFDILGWIGPEP